MRQSSTSKILKVTHLKGVKEKYYNKMWKSTIKAYPLNMNGNDY